MKRLLTSLSVLGLLIYGSLLADTFAPGDTVRYFLSRSDTLLEGTNAVSGEALKCYRWYGIVPTYLGDFTRVDIGDSGTVGFYWVTDGDDEGRYGASWDGLIQGRAPDMALNFTVESPGARQDSLEAMIARIMARADTARRRLGIPTRTVADDIADLESAMCPAQGGIAVSIVVLDTSQTPDEPVADAHVAVHYIGSSAPLVVGWSGLDGMMSFSMAQRTDPDSIVVYTRKLPVMWFGAPDTVVIADSTVVDTVRGTPFDPGTPGSVQYCKVYGYTYGVGGPIADVRVTAELSALSTGESENVFAPLAPPSYLIGSNILSTRSSAHQDSLGYWSLDVIKSKYLSPTAYVKWRVYMTYPEEKITAIPDSASVWYGYLEDLE